VITLSSDFGSPYPAAMKGVLLEHTDARLVDVGHEFPRQDVRAAAFWLREVLPYFPPAVHLVVVDPGVGTDRAALAVSAGDAWLVGPDNGVLLPVARTLAGDEDAAAPAGTDGAAADGDALEVHEVVTEDPDSSTFHGRDVFAPAAGRLHESGPGPLREAGLLRPADDHVDLELPTATVREDGADGEVLVVDDFGNAITNVPGSVLDGAESVRVNGADPVPAARTFASVDPGEPLATVGSHGNVELDVNRGRGDEWFDLAPGDAVSLEVR
jgi:S-adenosylmethionine hydrolase